MKNGLKVYI